MKVALALLLPLSLRAALRQIRAVYASPNRARYAITIIPAVESRLTHSQPGEHVRALILA